MDCIDSPAEAMAEAHACTPVHPEELVTYTVELVVPSSVKRGIPFIATVDVRSGEPGRSVTIMLEQKRGVGVFWPPQSAVTLSDEGGMASASFTLMLEGPTTAVLIATAYDRVGTYFNPDGAALAVS
jgi:hypothetical protein